MAARRSNGGTRLLQFLSALVLFAFISASSPLAATQQLRAVALGEDDDEQRAPLHDLIGLRCKTQSDCGYLPSLACIQGCVVLLYYVPIVLLMIK